MSSRCNNRTEAEIETLVAKAFEAMDYNDMVAYVMVKLQEDFESMDDDTIDAMEREEQGTLSQKD